MHQNINVYKTLNFGEENLSLIPDIDKLIALKCDDAVLKYLELINFSKNYPQHHNLLHNNLRSNTGSIVENNSLVVKPLKQIFATVINIRLPEIETLIDKFREKNLLTSSEVHTLRNTIQFLQNAYIETEDVDGNIVKGDRKMINKLRDFYDKLHLWRFKTPILMKIINLFFICF